MPFWKFTGTAPVRVGGQKVCTGDVVQFSGSPGANFNEVADMKGRELHTAQPPPKVASSQTSSGSSTKAKKES